jgi:two-component system, LuxR family, sensor kinase FixL
MRIIRGIVFRSSRLSLGENHQASNLGKNAIGIAIFWNIPMSELGRAMVDHGRAPVKPAPLKPPRDAFHGHALAFPTALLGTGYLAAYVLLDWISYIAPYGPLAITPWNPNTGLSITVILLFGRRMIPFQFAAPLLGDLAVLQFPMPAALEVATAVLIGGVYGAAMLFLLHPKRHFDRGLQSMSDLVLLSSTVLVSSTLVASGYVGMMCAAGLLPVSDFAAASLSYWIGDMIGIIAITPFALILWTRRHVLAVSAESLLQFAAILATLTLVYGYWTTQHLQLFYLFLLPIVWIAIRTGIEGVSLAVLTTQLGLIIGLHFFPDDIKELPKIQAFMLVLALTGLFAGVLVTERRRTEAVLRLHQESLARLARLGSVGELAAAVAHELNQPLMAAGTYTRLVDEAIRSGDANTHTVAETAKKAAAQVERAAEVVRRLRALVRLDRTNRVACRVDRIVRETIDLCRPDLDRAGVKVHQSVAAGLPPVMIDMLQIQQALLNLVRNSIDAMGETGQGTISIEAALVDMDFTEVRVRDSGPGFSPDRAGNPFLPFSSTKKEGLGIGLPLCRSLIEAHGGRIWLDASSPGATIHFTLPVAKLAVTRSSSHD